MAKEIKALTGIRGYAALWVCAFHSQPLASRLLGFSSERKNFIVSTGFLGVDLFFILSGFVLMMSYGGSVTTRLGIRKFITSRLFRILPLHWFALSILVILFFQFPNDYWGPGPFSIRALFACIFLVQSWGLSSSIAWNNPEWSLSAEWLVYFCFPILALILKKIGSVLFLITLPVLAALSLAAIFIASHSYTMDHAELGGLIRCVLEFFIGACLYRISQKLSLSRYGDLFILAGCSWLLLILVLPILQLSIPVAFSLLVLGCATSSKLARLIFANRIAMLLGAISFSLYLMHSITINAAESFSKTIPIENLGAYFPYVTIFVLESVILMISYMTWRFIENPSHNFGKSFSSRFTATADH